MNISTIGKNEIKYKCTCGQELIFYSPEKITNKIKCFDCQFDGKDLFENEIEIFVKKIKSKK